MINNDDLISMLEEALSKKQWSLVKKAITRLEGVEAPVAAPKVKRVKVAASPQTQPNVRKQTPTTTKQAPPRVRRTRRTFDEPWYNKFEDDHSISPEESVKKNKKLGTKQVADRRPPVEYVEIQCAKCGRTETITASAASMLKVDKTESITYRCNKCLG